MESTKYYLGLDVGGTNMVAGVVDEKLCGEDENKVNGEILFEAAKQGDSLAKQIVDDYIVRGIDGFADPMQERETAYLRGDLRASES